MAIRTMLWSNTRQEENGEYQITRSLMIFYSLPNVIWGYQIKKNEMGREYCTYERQERCIQGFGWET